MDQEAILTRALKNNTPAQAYLISAPSQERAEAAAEKFIMGLFCQTHSACGACLECRRFAAGNQIDCLKIANDQATIKMAEVRAIPDFLSKKPLGGGNKAVYIPQAHKLPAQAQNYLLKSIEEPEDGVVFVLATDTPKALLPTVISRCMWVRLAGLSVSDLEKRLQGKITPARLRASAAWAKGSEKMAMALALDEEWFEMRKAAAKAAYNFATKKRPSLFEMESAILTYEKRIDEMLTIFLSFFRDGAQIKLAREGAALLNPDYEDIARAVGAGFTSAQLSCIMELIVKRIENKRGIPGIRNRLLAEGMLFEMLEVRAHDASDRRAL